MAERETTSSAKRMLRLTPAIGDWTTLKPQKAPPKKIKMGIYGFDRLSQTELSIAHLIHYRFGEAFVKRVKESLQISGELYSLAAEQTSYSDFLKKIFQPVVQGRIKIKDVAREIAFCVEMPLANTLINYSLGSRDLAPINRALTEIEGEVLKTLINENLQVFSSAFEGVFKDCSFDITSSEEIIEDPTLKGASTYIFFTIEVSFAEGPPQRIYLGYTGKTLKSLIEKVEINRLTRSLNLARLPSQIKDKVLLSVAALLGETTVTPDELKELEVGDVVSLETMLKDIIPVMLARKIKLSGRPGVKRKKMAVRILAGREVARPVSREEVAPIQEFPLEEKEELEYTPEEGLAEEEEESEIGKGG